MISNGVFSAVVIHVAIQTLPPDELQNLQIDEMGCVQRLETLQ